MAWRLFGAKSLPDEMLTSYQLDRSEQNLIESECKHNHCYSKMHLKMPSAKTGNFGYFIE